MLELRSAATGVVTCVATQKAVDAVISASGAGAFRVAPDEAMLMAPSPGDTNAIAASAHDRAAAIDADAVVLDASDGWTAWALEGDATSDAFARLSALELPQEGFVQGEVAGVAVRVIAEPGRLVLLVPAMWSGHVHSRILSRCGDLDVREATR